MMRHRVADVTVGRRSIAARFQFVAGASLDSCAAHEHHLLNQFSSAL
jgi:hypothetical protein